MNANTWLFSESQTLESLDIAGKWESGSHTYPLTLQYNTQNNSCNIHSETFANKLVHHITSYVKMNRKKSEKLCIKTSVLGKDTLAKWKEEKTEGCLRYSGMKTHIFKNTIKESTEYILYYRDFAVTSETK